MNTSDHKTDYQLTKRVLGRINDEHLSPRPRWEFLVKNYAFWGLGTLAVVCGALAFSAVLFEIQNVDWRLSSATHADLISFFFATAPFVWVFVLALFTLFGYLYVRRTTHGYRYPLTMVILGVILLSVAFGSALYAAGLGGAVEEGVGDHPPFYRPILTEERSWWLAPENGLLGGEVEQVAPDASSFSLRDFSGHTWNVDTSDLRDRDLAAVEHGGIVRVIGAPATSSAALFHACFVFSWMMRGMPQGAPQHGPMPWAVASTSGENITNRGVQDPSALCKNIRPYEQLHRVEDTW